MDSTKQKKAMTNGGSLIKQISRDNEQHAHPDIYSASRPCYTTPSRWEVEKIDTTLIAARLRTLRLSNHLTRQELAERCRFPGPWKVSRLEGGKKGSGITDLTTLEIVCRELGIEVWELLKPDEVPDLPDSPDSHPLQSSTEDDQ